MNRLTFPIQSCMMKSRKKLRGERQKKRSNIMNIFDELTFLLVSQHSKISFASQYFMSNIEGLKNFRLFRVKLSRGHIF